MIQNKYEALELLVIETIESLSIGNIEASKIKSMATRIVNIARQLDTLDDELSNGERYSLIAHRVRIEV